MSSKTYAALICIALSLVLITGCMGFGGSQKIAAKRVKGDVVGPKKQQGWDSFKWPAYNGPKKRVSVGEVKTGSAHKMAKAMTEAIRAELESILFATKRFAVLERQESKVKGMLTEQDMGAAGMTHAQSSPKGGKLIGAAYSIDATIIKLQDHAGGGALGGIGASSDGRFGGWKIGGKRCEVDIQVKIRDNQTGQIIASFTGEGYDAKGSIGITSVKVSKHRIGAGGLGSYAKTSLGRAAKRAVNESVLSIVNTLGKKKWKGIVIKVPDDTKVAIKGGKDMNIRKGMRLKVLHKLEELKDPTTGESLGFETKEVATVVISKVLEKFSYAKLESGSLEDVEMSDFLHMIEAAPDKGGDASKL
ncbi:CsgG/HfaB family protein [Planctomycetota bacterium]